MHTTHASGASLRPNLSERWSRLSLHPRWLLALAVMGLVLSIMQPAESARRHHPAPDTTAPRESPPQATTHVYRCGQQYQRDPCLSDSPDGHRVAVADTRTADQIRSAYLSRQAMAQHLTSLEKSNRAASHRAGRKRSSRQHMVGLSCHAPGARPFEQCSGISTLSTAQAANTPRRQHPGKKKRATGNSGPYAAATD